MMHNTCLNSAVSLRCRVSPSSQFTDPTYFQDTRFDSNPLLIVSSFTSCCSCCCCCCCTANSNLIYNRLPRINPRYLCNGLRQSTLIQFSPSKRLNFHGSRRQPCNTTSGFSSLTDSDRNYYYDKLSSFKEKKKLGNGRCYGIENQKKEQRFSNSIDDDCLNDVEILLDLLTEEVGLENIGVRERKRTNKKDNKTKIVSSGSVKKNLKHDNKAVKIQCMEEEEEEEEDRRLINKKKEEEKGSFVKKVNRERKKEGSSCSSYYSVSSTGEFESDNDVEVKHDVGESSREYKDDQRRDSYRSYNEENVKRREDFEEEKNEILKKKNTDERYYGHQEWRKESEKKLDVESSSQQQSQVSVYNDRKSQNQEKTDRIISQSQLQSGMNYKRLTETDKKLSTSVQEQRETADFRRQLNMTSEISGIQEMNMKKASSSSSSSLIKNQEHKSTEVNTSHVENRREEKHERINQSTTLQESRMKSQQISTTSDTQITNNENNTSVSHTQSDIKSEKQELHLDTSRTEKVTMAEKVDLRRKQIEDKSSSSSSRLELVTESKKTGRKTTKASSFNIGGESSSTYKALKLNPEHNLQESRGQLHVGQPSQHIETIQESSRIQQSEISGVDLDIHSELIASADEEHKSSTQFLGEFVDNANNKLIASQDRHDHKTHEEQESVYEEDDNLNTSGELIKKNGRSLWNVIGDVVRLRWSSSSRSETPISKSDGEKASSHQSGSEAWFSGHEHEDSHDEILKTGSAKGRSGRRTDDNSPLLLPSSSNPNQGSSSKTMSPSVIEESSSFPVPAIRMRRSPVVKRSGSDETDASGSGKMENTAQTSPTSSSGKMVKSTEISPSSGSGKMVIMDEPIRKLARIDQVSRDRFDEWEEAYDIETKQRKIDEYFMKEALLEAKKGADFWEVPVGAVLVHDGKIIARGYNLVEELRDSTAHAEMICIREASNNLRSWRLSGSTLYVTLEPCPMCAGAILQARVDTVVWGAPNKLLGADGSWISFENLIRYISFVRLFPDVDGGNGSDKPAAPVHPFHPNMRVRRGVLSSECADVMQQFFQLRRKKKEKKNEPPTPPSSCLPITHGHHQSKLLGKMHNGWIHESQRILPFHDAHHNYLQPNKKPQQGNMPFFLNKKSPICKSICTQ
ncbi:hypothetical protein LXL04_011176 [Taraxacum kok-saghyz]